MALCWHSAFRGECRRVCTHSPQGPHRAKGCFPVGCELKPMWPHMSCSCLLLL